MAFNDPPSILAGITHPQVISTPGAGDAIAGGLGAVLGAIYQKQQLDAKQRADAADLAQKQAQTEHEIQLAKFTGAETDVSKQKAKDLKKAADDLQQKQMYEKVAASFVGQHSEFADNPDGFWATAHQAMEAGALPKDILPYLGPAYSTYGKTSEQVGQGLKAMAEGNVAQQTQGSQVAAANLKPQALQAQIAESRANTANTALDIQQKQQKQRDTEMQRYLLANDNDPMKAYAKYITDKKLANTQAGAAQGPQLAMQFQALAKSPVTGLKPTDIDRVSKMYLSDPQVKPLMQRATQYGTALGALRSAAQGNKAATGSAYINVIKAIDQPTNLRFMMLDWAKSYINPDITDMTKKTFDKYFHGTIPANVVQGMYKHMVDMRAQDKAQLKSSYDWYTQHYPEAADKIKDPNTIFGDDSAYTLGGAGGTADSATAQLMKKYGLTPK